MLTCYFVFHQSILHCIVTKGFHLIFATSEDLCLLPLESMQCVHQLGSVTLHKCTKDINLQVISYWKKIYRQVFTLELNIYSQAKEYNIFNHFSPSHEPLLLN